MDKIYIKWEDLNLKWEDINMTWEEIAITEEISDIIRKKGGLLDYIKGNPWDITKKLEDDIGKEKSKKFIKLLCRINNIEYEDSIEIKDIKIKAEHIEKVINEGAKIGIKLN